MFYEPGVNPDVLDAVTADSHNHVVGDLYGRDNGQFNRRFGQSGATVTGAARFFATPPFQPLLLVRAGRLAGDGPRRDSATFSWNIPLLD